MRAMQYTIQLPTDFSADMVRKRVEERARFFDNLPGLVHKSFLFDEAEHLYAPFYIWGQEEAARDFLLNDLFKGVIDTFSRPRVRTWSVIAYSHGNRAAAPTLAVREADLIPASADLSDMVKREQDRQNKLIAKNPDIYFHAAALDADRWEIVRYSLWHGRSGLARYEADCSQVYKVMHVSEPDTKQG